MSPICQRKMEGSIRMFFLCKCVWSIDPFLLYMDFRLLTLDYRDHQSSVDTISSPLEITRTSSGENTSQSNIHRVQRTCVGYDNKSTIYKEPLDAACTLRVRQQTMSQLWLMVWIEVTVRKGGSYFKQYHSVRNSQLTTPSTPCERKKK